MPVDAAWVFGAGGGLNGPAGGVYRRPDRQPFSRLARLSTVAGGSAGGVHPPIPRPRRLAFALSLIRGKCRRNSTTPASSPPSSTARRMASAVGSSTVNMPLSYPRPPQQTSDIARRPHQVL